MTATVLLHVDDVEASSSWYQRLLCCTSGHGGPDFEMLMDGQQLLIMLHRRDGHEHPSTPAAGSAVGSGVCVYVRVADIYAVEAAANEMGVANAGVTRNELAHQEEIELRDPDGYHLTVCGPAMWASA